MKPSIVFQLIICFSINYYGPLLRNPAEKKTEFLFLEIFTFVFVCPFLFYKSQITPFFTKNGRVSSFLFSSQEEEAQLLSVILSLCGLVSPPLIYNLQEKRDFHCNSSLLSSAPFRQVVAQAWLPSKVSK